MNNRRITVRIEKELHTRIETFIETEGFDTYIDAVKFLLRFTYISRSTYPLSAFNDLKLTYVDRIEKKMAFSEKLTRNINSVSFNCWQLKHSFNDKVNILLWIGIKEYQRAIQKKEGRAWI